MKKRIPTICFIISAVLAAGFVVKNVIDYLQYSPLSTSAPFSVCVLINALCFDLPALIVFFVGIALRNRQNKTGQGDYK